MLPEVQTLRVLGNHPKKRYLKIVLNKPNVKVKTYRTHLSQTLVSVKVFSAATLVEAGAIRGTEGVFRTINRCEFPIILNRERVGVLKEAMKD